MNLRRNYIWILPLLAIISAPFWWDMAGRLLGPGKEVSTPATASSQQLNTFVLQQVALVQNRAGVDELLVRAEKVKSGQGADELQMFAVDGQLIGEHRSLKISGDEASYNTARQIFTVFDHVRLVTGDGYSLETEVLRYFPRFQRVKTAEEVSMAGRGITLKGTGLVYDMPSGEFMIGGRVVVDLS